MASHQVAIAKASFSAGLLRPDPTSVPRDDIAAFNASLDRVLSHCSPANVQTCKAWLLRFVAPSANRVGGLAKYLVTLAGSFDNPVGTKPKASAKRRRLHILYLLNDLFHHSKFHLDTSAVFAVVSGTMQPYMMDLLGYAAAYNRPKHPRHHRRLDDLLDVWSEHGYFSPEMLYKMRETVKNAAAAGAPPPSSHDAFLTEQGNSTQKLSGRDAPFVMPSTHGDSSTPFYDLPAGNMIPHIIPNSTIPLRPESIKPLQFLAGPADESLVDALKVFLRDVDQIYGTEELIKGGSNVDVDELGQRITRDEITGDILDGETYYGWSREFCQQMKKRAPDGDRSPGRGARDQIHGHEAGLRPLEAMALVYEAVHLGNLDRDPVRGHTRRGDHHHPRGFRLPINLLILTLLPVNTEHHMVIPIPISHPRPHLNTPVPGPQSLLHNYRACPSRLE
ncbi:hypothetical protein N7492_000591 [Penicillium capsulatum]|uniref:CID domain-containing protein n=1 Tax=Penicillium capsulatum TaxID=69766 RepID=A0A9W9IQQ3_9EURO|nr:hypothetical protein N7492_000591 [Penicillium capsulatum]KAJ6130351.1 hypothetical protein N7512_003131 [Penicillium capsulatum]